MATSTNKPNQPNKPRKANRTHPPHTPILTNQNPNIDSDTLIDESIREENGDISGSSPLRTVRSNQLFSTSFGNNAPYDGARIVADADAVVTLAQTHIGERYILGARAPMANAGWTGPWDCAEFASWCLYQATGILFGVEPRHDPMRADAYTGYWEQQSRAANAFVLVDQAVSIAGAFLLRTPQSGRVGHIAISDGMGGTVEAHSSKLGVIAGKAGGRRWDFGVLVPGLRYFSSAEPVHIKQADQILRLTEPMQRGEAVRELQIKLNALGFFAGATDGIFGPQTESAVAAFQAARGLLVDGEFGPDTQKALKKSVK